MPQQTRKIGPTRRSVSGFHMFRGEQAIPYESTLERDFIIRHEFSRHVSDIIPQPYQIPFVGNNGRSYIYTPDFLVLYRLGDAPWKDGLSPLLVEVKPFDQISEHWREWSLKFKAAISFAKNTGATF